MDALREFHEIMHLGPSRKKELDDPPNEQDATASEHESQSRAGASLAPVSRVSIPPLIFFRNTGRTVAEKDTSCYKESEDRERAQDAGIQKGQPGACRAPSVFSADKPPFRLRLAWEKQSPGAKQAPWANQALGAGSAPFVQTGSPHLQTSKRLVGLCNVSQDTVKIATGLRESCPWGKASPLGKASPGIATR